MLYQIVFDLTGNDTGVEATVIMPFYDKDGLGEQRAWDWGRANWRAFGGSASRIKSVHKVSAPPKGETIGKGN